MLSLQTDNKAEARRVLLERRKQTSACEHAAKSEQTCDVAEKLIDEIGARTVLSFFPVRGEPDILPLAKRLLEKGITVAFPISHKEDVRLEFRAISALDDLKLGTYKICEPIESTQTLSVFENDTVCLVPALSFDMRGMRLGYGMGYYDRFLQGFCGISVGIAFSDFLVEDLPAEDTDIPVTKIITEGGVVVPDELRFKKENAVGHQSAPTSKE
ncbi:MAG: 5-formyltetrahydrofolate cyclo-ligase [Ruminococcaceae bacterium]|nr:5-formyltetrahydrofolate cyclo-ligase [Oscillospiraceae bacterium]